jgi:UDP-N-acetylmuramoyl-tripeptide--D-alanyl-D-alanine ligase
MKNYPSATVFTVGKNFYEIAADFNCQFFLNVELFCKFLQEKPITNGDILIKGSRGIQLEKVLSFI